MSNKATIQGIYEAFGRGDIPAILEKLSEDVEWEYGIEDTGVPWLQERRGSENVTGFFEAAGGLEFMKFQPKELLESNNIVVALIDVSFKVRSTGRAVEEEDEVHIWHFDESGLVTRFCHRCDTYKHWRATLSD
ncbi:MAG: nuclear transport factor 2 family protein [Pyrinomonadaceae bacterium]